MSKHSNEKKPVALRHATSDETVIVPSERSARVLRKSGWKDAPKSEQPDASTPIK